MRNNRDSESARLGKRGRMDRHRGWDLKFARIRKSICQTNESVTFPVPLVARPPPHLFPNVIRLPALFCPVPLDRASTVLMILPTHEPDGGTPTTWSDATDKRRRRDKGLGAKGTAAKKRNETKGRGRRIILPARTRARRITGRRRRRKVEGWKGTAEPPREEAWWGVVKFVEGCFLLDLYFINYTRRARAHTQDERIRAGRSSVHRASTSRRGIPASIARNSSLASIAGYNHAS